MRSSAGFSPAYISCLGTLVLGPFPSASPPSLSTLASALMNNVRAIQKLNELELKMGTSADARSRPEQEPRHRADTHRSRRY